AAISRWSLPPAWDSLSPTRDGMAPKFHPKGNTMTALALKPPKFPHGRVYMTSRLISLVREGKIDALGYLERHLSGDWGDLSRLERQANEAALAGGRLF